MPSSFFTQHQLSNWYTSKQLSTYDIANKCECDPKTVFYWLQKYQIPTRQRKTVSINKKQLKHLYVSGLSLKTIGRRYHITASAVHRKMVRLALTRRTPWEHNIIHKRKNFSGNQSEKAYLMGFRIGDLNVIYNCSSIIVKSNTTHLVQVNLMKSLFSKYGPVWISSPVTNKCVYHCTFGLNHSFKFLIQKFKVIPRWIMRSDHLFWSFLAGYTDAEGTIRVYAKRARFRIGSYDKTILKQIHIHLSQLGMKNSFRLESPADGIHRNGDFYRVDLMDRYALSSCLPKIFHFLKHGRRREDARAALINVSARI
jgi:hypothetical protein